MELFNYSENLMLESRLTLLLLLTLLPVLQVQAHTNSVGFIVSNSAITPCVAGSGANCHDVEVFFGSWHNSVGGAEGDLAIFIQNSDGSETQVIGQSATGGVQVPFSLNHSLLASLPNFNGTNYWSHPELLSQYFSLGENYFFHNDVDGTLSATPDDALYFEMLMGHQSAVAAGLGAGTYRVDYDLATKSGLSADWRAMPGIGNSRFRLLTDGRISVLIAPSQFTSFAKTSSFSSVDRMADALGAVRPTVRTSATTVGAMFEGLYNLDIEGFYQSVVPLSGQIHAISLGDVSSFNLRSHEVYIEQLNASEDKDGYWTKSLGFRSVSQDNYETTGREQNSTEFHFGRNFMISATRKVGVFFGSGSDNIKAKSSGKSQITSFVTGLSYLENKKNWPSYASFSLGSHNIETSRIVPLYQKLNRHTDSRNLISAMVSGGVKRTIQTTENFKTTLDLGMKHLLLKKEKIRETGSQETSLAYKEKTIHSTYLTARTGVEHNILYREAEILNSFSIDMSSPLSKQPHQRLSLHGASWNTFSAPNIVDLRFAFNSSVVFDGISTIQWFAEKSLSGIKDFKTGLEFKANF